jgi:hypothetical protein
VPELTRGGRTYLLHLEIPHLKSIVESLESDETSSVSLRLHVG